MKIENIMKAFRVDARDLEVGKPVPIDPGPYRFAHQTEKCDEVIERFRPDEKPKKAGCLYLFSNLRCAERWYCRTRNVHIYEVALDRKAILHRGNLTHYDERFPKDEALQESWAKAYWREEFEEFDCEELLCDGGAVVVAQLRRGDDPRRLNFCTDIYRVRNDEDSFDISELSNNQMPGNI